MGNLGNSSAEAWPWPESLDALLAAPGYHTLILENASVRVVRTRIPPAHTVPLHTHRWPCVLVIASWSDLVRRDASGGVTLDTRLAPEPPLLNTPTWQEALPPHSVENVGSWEIDLILVEIKAAAGV